jgi:Glycosyltransferase family 87
MLSRTVSSQTSSARISGPRGPSALRARQGEQALKLFVYCAVPLMLTLYVLRLCVQLHLLGTDFHHEFWPAAHLVTQGLSPYEGSWQHIRAGVAFPYPALTSLALVPFALIPRDAADFVFVGMNLAAVILTLRALDVRDIRVYGVAFCWPIVIQAWQAANLTVVLGLGIAWLWRQRDRPVVAGLLLGVLVSLKPFLWPLGLWLLATRRYRASAYAVAWTLLLNVIAWAAVGFDQLGRYESTVKAVTSVMYARGYDLIGVAMRLGLGHGMAYAFTIIGCAAIAIACVYVGRRGDGRAALALAISLSLMATPVLWAHYFALMIVVVALARPRLSGLWFVPLLLWVCPVVNPTPWQAIWALAVVALLVGIALLRPRSSSPPQDVESNARRLSRRRDMSLRRTFAVK